MTPTEIENKIETTISRVFETLNETLMMNMDSEDRKEANEYLERLYSDFSLPDYCEGVREFAGDFEDEDEEDA